MSILTSTVDSAGVRVAFLAMVSSTGGLEEGWGLGGEKASRLICVGMICVLQYFLQTMPKTAHMPGAVGLLAAGAGKLETPLV